MPYAGQLGRDRRWAGGVAVNGTEIESLVHVLARLPGLGPRSARRVVLHLLKRRDAPLKALIEALVAVERAVRRCSVCGNLDTSDPCALCRDPERDSSVICVVEDVADLWALERTRAFRGLYHVLGGTLSALDGIGPDDLAMDTLLTRAHHPEVTEVILALNATIDGQTTAHVLTDRLAGVRVTVSRLAQGVPLGGELDYLDDGTLTAALKARRSW